MRRTTKPHAPSAGEASVRGAVRDYKSIREDYRYDASPFSEEPERTARVKFIIDTKLSQVDRTLILLYADCQSLRKLGKRLGLSHTCVAKEIRRIRESIINEYKTMTNNERERRSNHLRP